MASLYPADGQGVVIERRSSSRARAGRALYTPLQWKAPSGNSDLAASGQQA